ncbi:MAG: hypothetical protein ACOH12_10090 [Parvibaculaceae bacterium]
MGLAITRRVGDTFWIGDDWFQVREVGEPSGFVVVDRKGKTYSVPPGPSVLLSGDTAVREGFRNKKGLVRIAFDGPTDTPIWRGELREDSARVDLSQTEAALLAPVPYEHLASALDTCSEMGKVAFGSRAWEVFRDLDQQADGLNPPVLIYASHDAAPFPPMVSWTASYVGHVEGRGGRHPAKLDFRPASTEKYASDNAGHWAIFWEVGDLRHLGPDAGIKVGSLVGLHSGKSFDAGFRPLGPVLIENPFLTVL